MPYLIHLGCDTLQLSDFMQPAIGSSQIWKPPCLLQTDLCYMDQRLPGLETAVCSLIYDEATPQPGMETDIVAS